MSNTRPLVVDLDGTLVQSDLLIESSLSSIRLNPTNIFTLLAWLTQGKVHLKEQLAKSIELDIATLPYNSQVLALIHKERANGRQIVLATASHKIYADQIAEHLQCFNHVLATEKSNLSGKNKRDQLIEIFGESGFDYIGNSKDDLPVWSAAHRSYLVNPELGIKAKAIAIGNVEQIISSPYNSFATWFKALRIHQWMKNLLVFVPLLASHQLSDPNLLLNGILAFILFGLCASSVYLLNDLLDLTDDRHHSTKRNRPFASGRLSVKSGILLFPILLIIAFTGAIWLLPSTFSIALGCYYFLTLAYSLIFKRWMMVDVITLALLYTLRIIAGTFAFNLELTFWMLAFSMFIFLSLALVKRYAELREARIKGKTGKSRGRGYYPDDLEMISSLGAASGYLSVMVLALYIQDLKTTSMYQFPEIIWFACPLLLFWISRVWLLTHRGQMHDDPVIFAAKDKVSLLVGGIFGIIFWLAT